MRNDTAFEECRVSKAIAAAEYITRGINVPGCGLEGVVDFDAFWCVGDTSVF